MKIKQAKKILMQNKEFKKEYDNLKDYPMPDQFTQQKVDAFEKKFNGKCFATEPSEIIKEVERYKQQVDFLTQTIEEAREEERKIFDREMENFRMEYEHTKIVHMDMFEVPFPIARVIERHLFAYKKIKKDQII